MPDRGRNFDAFLAEEVAKVRGRAVPVKTGFLRRRLIRRVALRHLHPNPDDEFCNPSIGPNYSVITEYEHIYRKQASGDHLPSELWAGKEVVLMVERIRPDGYMILNGHHRWAGARRSGIVTHLPVKVVNLTHEKDIERMIRASKHDRRAVFDLDEVVLARGPEEAETRPPFPRNLGLKHYLRIGFPGLCHFLNNNGWDIWIYSPSYYSQEDVRILLRRYNIHVTGVVTGIRRKAAAGAKERMEHLIYNTYQTTVNIDRQSVFSLRRADHHIQDFSLSGNAADWSREVQDILLEMNV